MAPDHARWTAMGCVAEMIVVGGPSDAMHGARARLDEIEQRWSRFLPGSDVSRMNINAGRPVEVDGLTTALVRTAILAWRESGGVVNPTVLGAVLRAGYVRTFGELEQHVERGASDAPAAPSSALQLVACTDIEVHDNVVVLPAGTGFDPGGIGKGLAADLIVDELMAAGCRGACVNVGGDLRVEGVGPTDAGWTIAIDCPDPSSGALVEIGLGAGAVATSTTARRRWRRDGVDRHHLIDPGTGEPSTTDIVQASAVTGRCWLAETYAKTILLRGSGRAFDSLPTATGAIAVTADGRVMSTPSLRPHLATEAPARIERPTEVR